MKIKILVGLILILTSLTINAQPNNYFQNNENWSIESFDADGYRSHYYMYTSGDTIIGSDTLVKIMLYGGYYAPGNIYLSDFGSTIDPAFLVKDSNQVLTVYALFSNAISDTSTTDFSRIDSITNFRTDIQWYEPFPIQETDTFYYNGISRRIFNPNQSGTAYEGIFDQDGEPYIPYIAISGNSTLLCFGAFDSTYFHFPSQDFNTPSVVGNCIITNLGVENFSEMKITLYPNPVDQILRIEFAQNKVEVNYSILNLQGQILQSGLTSSSVLNLDVSNLSNGMYLIRCDLNESSSSTIFIKK